MYIYIYIHLAGTLIVQSHFLIAPQKGRSSFPTLALPSHIAGLLPPRPCSPGLGGSPSTATYLLLLGCTYYHYYYDYYYYSN